MTRTGPVTCPKRRWRPARAALRLLPWLFAAIAANAQADVRARIEPRIIDELETARLVLRATGTELHKIDLTALEADFEVLGTQTASQYQSVNGAVEAWVEYQITLRPTRAGRLTVPAIQVGDERSDPVTLEVRGIDPALRERIDRMVFFELEVSRNPVYVRSETVVTRRLYYSAQTQIYSDLPGPPELRDALVLPLGETRSSTQVRDGERYGVIEQQFALFPERPGRLTIPSVSLTSSVRLQIDGRIRRTGARVASQPLDIEVLPVPPEYPADQPWLPASEVTLTDRWSPDRPSYAVGEPLSRSVEIRVSGNLAAAIAPPADGLPEPGFRQYADPAVLTDDRGGTGIVGRRTTRYAVIPTAPGTVTLPELAVTWWDVEARRVRTARTGPRQVVIEGSAVASTTTAGTAPALPDEPTDGTIEPVSLPDPGDAWTDVQRHLLAGSLLLGCAALAWAVLYWRAKQRSPSSARLRRAWRRFGQRVARSSPAHALRLRRLRKATLVAARAGDPTRIHRAFIAYLCCLYGLPPSAAVTKLRNAGLGDLLDRVNAARFARGEPEPPPDAPALAHAMRALTAHPPPRDPLPELFASR